MPCSTSSILTSLPNSFGLCAFPLRITCVCGSNRLSTLSGTRVFPPHRRSLVCTITFSTKGRKCRSWPGLHFDFQQTSDDRQLSFPPPLDYLTGLPHHFPSQGQELVITLAHALTMGFALGLRRAADLEQAMLHRPSMIHHFHGAALALGSDAFQAAAEHANTVTQQRAVRGKVHVRLNGSCVGP